VEVRRLPVLTPETETFWTGGADGVLRFLRCQDDGYYIHPPSPACPKCQQTNVAYEPVSGKATVHTYTVNYQAWAPDQTVPYVVAVVELPEQDGLRLTTNIVGCPVEDVHIDQPVHVTFLQAEDVWLPLFTPDEENQ
jgi:uncharacterized OB-fold protein